MSFAGCGIFRKTVIGILAISTVVVLFKQANKLETTAATSEAYVPPPINLN
jgi:hypothetical protein